MKLEEIPKPDYEEVLEELVLRGILNIRDIPFEARVVNRTLYVYAFRRNRCFNNEEECLNYKNALDTLKDDISMVDNVKFKKARKHLYDFYRGVATDNDIYKKFLHKTQKRNRILSKKIREIKKCLFKRKRKS